MPDLARLVAGLAAVAPVVCGSKAPGSAVSPSSLRCVNYTAMAGSTQFCKDYITWPVVHFAGQDMAALDKSLKDGFGMFASITTPSCVWQNQRLGCWMQFPKCVETEVGGATFAVPHYPCNDVCTFTLQNCTDVYDSVAAMGNMIDLLPMCGDGLGGRGGEAERRYGQEADLFGVRVSPAIIDLCV
jgi:hypothetical protein